MIANARRPEAVLINLALLTVILNCGGANGPISAGAPCDLSEAGTRPDTGTVVVRGTEAPCVLEFREVVTLRGGLMGDLPKLPIVPGPNGQWLSGTYDPGEVAVWSASGHLTRTIGRGPGQGPGEFMQVRDMLVDTLAGTVYIYAGATRIEVYSLDGEYVRDIPLPGMAAWGARLADGTIVSTVEPATPEPFLVLTRGDSIWRVGPKPKFVFPPLLRAADDGIWSAEGPWYEIDHHAPSDGHIDFRVKREAPWYTEPSTTRGVVNFTSGVLNGFAIDSRTNLIVATVSGLQDPNGPEALAELPAEGGAPVSMPRTAEERERNRRQRFDAIVEAFTMDGRLISSERYDMPRDAPLPLNVRNSISLWYRVNSDESASIQILELALKEKSDTN